MANDLNKALENYELGFRHAKAYDHIPKITKHTSFLVKGKILDMSKTNSSAEATIVARQIGCLHSWGVMKG